MDIRRVVTGHDKDGKAIVVDDQMVAPVVLDLVARERVPSPLGRRFGPVVSRRRVEARVRGINSPPLGGFRFGFFTIPPDSGVELPPGLDIEAAMAEFEEQLPGLGRYLDPEEPGMHTTATVDYGVVISGQATLELDDGAKVVLNAGDTYIQNGTRHRWSNSGDVPAVMAITLIGAHHDKVD